MTSHAVDRIVVLKPLNGLCAGVECDEMECALEELVRQGRRVVVDLGATRFLTAHALGVLAQAEHTASLHGGRIALCQAAGLERWLLQLTHLTEALPVYGSEEEAIRGLREDRASA
jgi:anti-anti-sigma factor